GVAGILLVLQPDVVRVAYVDQGLEDRSQVQDAATAFRGRAVDGRARFVLQVQVVEPRSALPDRRRRVCARPGGVAHVDAKTNPRVEWLDCGPDFVRGGEVTVAGAVVVDGDADIEFSCEALREGQRGRLGRGHNRRDGDV